VVLAYVFYLVTPAVPVAIGKALAPVVKVLENKYYLDWFNEHVLAAGARQLGRGLWKGGDMGLIDGVIINGSARLVGGIAGLTRLLQTGHVYWYALVMLLGVFGLLTWQLWPALSGLAGR
jgi:NADH-quinone oxidoreductase subunit L